MCSTWTGDFGHPFVPASQQQALEKELSTQPQLLETTWWFMVSIKLISSCDPSIIHHCYAIYLYLFSFCVSISGGNVHIHYQEEKCYDEEIFFYHLGCHQWVSTGERWSLSEFLWTVSSVTNTIHSFHLQLVVVASASIPTALTKVFCFFF